MATVVQCLPVIVLEGRTYQFNYYSMPHVLMVFEKGGFYRPISFKIEEDRPVEDALSEALLKKLGLKLVALHDGLDAPVGYLTAEVGSVQFSAPEAYRLRWLACEELHGFGQLGAFGRLGGSQPGHWFSHRFWVTYTDCAAARAAMAVVAGREFQIAA